LYDVRERRVVVSMGASVGCCVVVDAMVVWLVGVVGVWWWLGCVIGGFGVSERESKTWMMVMSLMCACVGLHRNVHSQCCSC